MAIESTAGARRPDPVRVLREDDAALPAPGVTDLARATLIATERAGASADSRRTRRPHFGPLPEALAGRFPDYVPMTVEEKNRWREAQVGDPSETDVDAVALWRVNNLPIAPPP